MCMSIPKLFFDILIVLQYTVREAAKVANLWETAPYMDEISSAALQTYYEAVSTVTVRLVHV